RLAPGERFPGVALGPQALQDDADRGSALLKRRLSPVQNYDSPTAAGAIRQRLHHRALVGRSLVVEYLALVPALASGARRYQFERPLEIRLVSSPGGSDRGLRVGSLAVDDCDVRIGLRRLNDRQALSGGDRPTCRNRESRTAGCYPGRVGCEAFRRRSCFCLCL